MQLGQFNTRRAIILLCAIFISVAILAQLFGDIPLDFYRSYGPGDGALPNPQAQSDTPQPGYFKSQPEWDFPVPSNQGRVRKPRAQDVIVLTASDGGGHNSQIPHVLERVLQNRQEYCDHHGFTNLWLNTSRYDIKDAHRTWSKIPAVAEAFYLNPRAEWILLLDTDIVIMNMQYPLIDEIIAPAAIERGIMRDTPILDGQIKHNPTNVSTPSNIRVQDIDILITQDHQMINTGSVFFRRSAFTRYLLEIMTDYTMLMGNDHPGAEQDALKHLMLEHPLVRNHVGVYPQRKFNAYVQGGDNMGYRDGDFLVHFAGCWVSNKCADWFEEFWQMKGWVPGKSAPWRPVGGQ